MLIDWAIRGAVLLAGMAVVLYTLAAAIRAFVLPRNESVLLSTVVFRSVRLVFHLIAATGRTFARRDRVLALYAPVALVALPIAWLGLIALGYTGMLWAVGEGSWTFCYRLSSNSLLTLGSDKANTLAGAFLSYSEATWGLLLMTLLISYLPTIYQAFSRRELVVAQLELRAGAPSTATNLLVWLNRSGTLLDDDTDWRAWEEWFVEIDETHTSLPVLSFFRSPQPGRSWIATAGILLDAAALIISAVEQPRSNQVELTFKAGCLAVNRVYRFFDRHARSKPTELLEPNDALEEPSRQEFFEAYKCLQEHNLKLHPDPEAAWRHYHTLRGRYNEPVTFLAKLLTAPDVKTV
ncbi:hypothetical protein [Hymenobacter latericus]|uniref:hypothetical protein n=1 Tax=Hymenobacter sp. YIM 151858-1 TaxID=2987688 RepID=UPI002227ADDF|nr:hypothetical protein [Hymenobacter sp. YIM 151858-1]UYZ58664.1 hypothetical protein OIS50_16570 [Hymenobacter sp. YIM 151858-1]